jgi:hypothetical protein
MVTKIDRDRKSAKAKAIIDRLVEIHETRELLIGMLDEDRLDMLALGLGLGKVVPTDVVVDEEARWGGEL